MEMTLILQSQFHLFQEKKKCHLYLLMEQVMVIVLPV